MGNTFTSLNNEQGLLVAISNGDVRSFEIIFNHYSKPLGNYANRMMEDAELAEDLVQEVFISIWLNRAELHKIISFKDYLFILSKNRILNTLKRKSKEALIRLEDDKYLQSTLVSNDLSEEIIYKENIYDLLESKISQLPLQQKKVFTLAKFEKKSYKEIAVTLNISIETVRKHMFLAIKTLKKEISKDSVDALVLLIVMKLF